MYSLFRPLLFKFDPEKVHHFVTAGLKAINRYPVSGKLMRSLWSSSDKRLQKNVFGLDFKNPVGLAAGFDKNADLIDEMAALGFGFIEIGTVTPLSQEGNPKPRMFRLPADKALINRMGFNNHGVEAAAKNIADYRRKVKSPVIIGGNIGKNKNTPNHEAVNDYLKCFNSLFNVVDYFVVNVSSPNTPGLRELQEKAPLLDLLITLQKRNAETTSPKPILLKIAPDLNNQQLDDIIDIVIQSRIAGVIATNTTISRDNLKAPEKLKGESGGLSGQPLNQRSTEIIRYIVEKSSGSFPVIGVGGIHSPQDALDKIKAGASLIQLYTGFIYEGPGLIKKINKALARNIK